MANSCNSTTQRDVLSFDPANVCVKKHTEQKRSVLSDLCARVVSVFHKKKDDRKLLKDGPKPLTDTYAASEMLAKSISFKQNPFAKNKLNFADLDFNTYSKYHMFTETIERYVPVRKDCLPINPERVLVIKKEGPNGMIMPWQ